MAPDPAAGLYKCLLSRDHKIIQKQNCQKISLQKLKKDVVYFCDFNQCSLQDFYDSNKWKNARSKTTGNQFAFFTAKSLLRTKYSAMTSSPLLPAKQNLCLRSVAHSN